MQRFRDWLFPRLKLIVGLFLIPGWLWLSVASEAVATYRRGFSWHWQYVDFGNDVFSLLLGVVYLAAACVWLLSPRVSFVVKALVVTAEVSYVVWVVAGFVAAGFGA